MSFFIPASSLSQADFVASVEEDQQAGRWARRRTMNAYREHLVDFEFVQELQTDVVPVFEIDVMKLPYAQTRFNESIRVENRMIVKT